MIEKFSNKHTPPLIFTDEALKEVLISKWPGNVRQLKNFVERVAVLSGESIITPKIVKYFLRKKPNKLSSNLHSIVRQIIDLDLENKITVLEYHVIQEVLEKSNANKSVAAKAMGVHRKTIERRLKTFDLDINEIHILCVTGKKCMALFDYEGALVQYEKAIGYLKKYSYGIAFDELKFEILLKQCVCIRNLYGWNSSKTDDKYENAIVIGKNIGKDEKLLSAYFGIWAKHLINLDLLKALDVAEKFLYKGSNLKYPDFISQAFLCIANTKYWLGEFEAVHENLSAFIELYESKSEIIIDYGYDPFVFYLMLSCLVSFHSGKFENVNKILSQLQRYTKEMNNPFSLSIALHVGAWLSFLMGNNEKSHEYCTQLRENLTCKSFVFYQSIGMIFDGYHTAFEGEHLKGIDLVKEGFKKMNDGNGFFFHSIYSIILGRIYIMCNRIDEGLSTLQKAICIADEKKEICYMSELLNIRGQLYYLIGDIENAEKDFIKAIHVAVRLKSIPAELDAYVALFDLLSSTGRNDEARKILKEAHLKISKQDNTYKTVQIIRDKYNATYS